MSIGRRAFLAWAAAVVPSGALVRRAHRLAVRALFDGGTTSETLTALAEVMLPSELGAPGAARIASDFRRWMSGYHEHAELTHGYGTSRLRYTGPTPVTRWTSQLDALDAAARRQFDGSFASIQKPRREQLVRAALAGTRLHGMPAIADAEHVAVALIAFFYDSPEATDLCYEAAIGPRACRPLATSSAPPAPLQRRPV